MPELLGRAKSARRSEADSDSGYRNEHGRPRVRSTDEKFESRSPPELLYTHIDVTLGEALG